MIFVITGSLRPFSRLLREVEHLIDHYNISEKVIVQGGYTVYSPKNFEMFDFVSDNQFKEYIHCANIVITHAGSGALFNAIKLQKKIVAVARLKKFGEHVDDHQMELARKLSEGGYILDGTDSLIETWEKIDSFVPRTCDFNQDIVDHLKNYLTTIS